MEDYDDGHRYDVDEYGQEEEWPDPDDIENTEAPCPPEDEDFAAGLAAEGDDDSASSSESTQTSSSSSSSGTSRSNSSTSAASAPMFIGRERSRRSNAGVRMAQAVLSMQSNDSQDDFGDYPEYASLLTSFYICSLCQFLKIALLRVYCNDHDI